MANWQSLVGYGLMGAATGAALAWVVEWLCWGQVRRPGWVAWLATAILSGALFALTAWRIPAGPYLLLVTAYVCALLVIGLVDVRVRRIPNVITYPAIVVALVTAPFVPGLGAVRALIGGGLSLALFLFIYALAGPFARRLAQAQGREAPGVPFGFGDVKLGLLIGLITGFPVVLPALFVGSLALGVVALAVLVARLATQGRQAFLSTIPFGPALVVGGLVGLLWGTELAYQVALGSAAWG
ncbi:MAG: A24 family peptidase [Chloroflexi bacterium]|nr:A24 family peptidase [Chloroflexota bacterium]